MEPAERGKLFWFTLWGLDRHDPDAAVWRVELRAGKHELARRWRLKTLDDVETSVGDLFRKVVEDVRYVAEHQTDSNVSRQRLHPLWRAVTEHLAAGALAAFRSGVLPSEIREIERESAVALYTSLTLGNLAGILAAQGLDDETLEAELSERLQRLHGRPQRAIREVPALAPAGTGEDAFFRRTLSAMTVISHPRSLIPHLISKYRLTKEIDLGDFEISQTFRPEHLIFRRL